MENITITGGSHITDATKSSKIVLESTDPTYSTYFEIGSATHDITDIECASENIVVSTTAVSVSTVTQCT